MSENCPKCPRCGWNTLDSDSESNFCFEPDGAECKSRQHEQARAEVEAMRPVVKAAVAWSDSASLWQGARLCKAVRAYLALPAVKTKGNG